MLVLAPEATQPRSNFFVDLPALAAAVGSRFSPGTGGRTPSRRRLGVPAAPRPASASCSASRWTCRRRRPSPGAPALRAGPVAPDPDVLPLASTRLLRPAGRCSSPGGARRAARRPGGADRAGRSVRRAAGDVGRGQGAVPGRPVEPRRVRRVRHPAGRRAHRRRRPRGRLGQHAEHVDDPARQADLRRHDGGPGRRGPGRARRATARSTSAWSAMWPVWPRSSNCPLRAATAPTSCASASPPRAAGGTCPMWTMPSPAASTRER